MKSGFTLIEMLIVVLIIGILAAIVLPQYRLAVIKSKYSTIKTMTQELVSAGERYYLATGNRPSKFSDLDISFNNVTGIDTSAITFPNGNTCSMWGGQYTLSTQQCIACRTYISGILFAFYKYFSWKKASDAILVYSTDANDVFNKFCKQETGNNAGTVGSSYRAYNYK